LRSGRLGSKIKALSAICDTLQRGEIMSKKAKKKVKKPAKKR